MTGYSCKYTPIELLAGFGAQCVRLDEEAPDFGAADAMTHPNLCAHARAVLEQYKRGGFGEMCFVNCCDALRRVWDAVQAEGAADFVFMMDLPHEKGPRAEAALTRELLRLADAYGAACDSPFDKKKFFAAFEAPKAPEGDFVALLGARAEGALITLAAERLSLPVIDLTCGGNRHVLPPEDTEDFAALMAGYARALLNQTPCLRMRDLSGRQALLSAPGLRGVIYHTVKFCDYYAFEYENLRKHLNVPLLRVETDFTPQSAGQLSTRLSAFAETLGAAPGTAKQQSGAGKGRYAAGIDSGSTSTNMVILDETGKMVAGVSVRTGARAQTGAMKALEMALEKAGIRQEDLGCVVATGYGRTGIPFATRAVTEITCHARGAAHIYPATRTIIDIGGQDSKVICLDETGAVKGFAMNDKCAAGTGRFLEKMAQALEMDMERFCAAGQRWQKEVTISSVCTVFAESEVVSLIADNCREEDIIHGLNRAVATRLLALVKRAGGEGPYMMTGGVARNPGVVAAISEAVGQALFVGPEPELCGALGAALMALEDMKNQTQTGA